MKIKLSVVALFLSLSLLVCSEHVYPDVKSVKVAAAADLAFAFKEIAPDFEKDTGIKVTFSFGSTGMLAKQIEHGAPFDVFFAANVKFMEGLKQKGIIIPDTMQLYAQGRIVLAANKSSGIMIKEMKDLLKPEIKKIAIANPDHAPYGIAAMETLKNVGIWEQVKSKIVYGENVRQTLQYIQSGTVPAGIVAISVANVPEITYAVIDTSLHNPINQSAAVVKTTKEEPLAREFIKYVNSPKGRAVMKKYGFFLPGEF
ncbi:MAG: molybdate ABC transporter substrate-binding protein [Deltaproteobacteria bacterium GWC2_42_11]|nr:MAG: molybdate ABC transporter substrate-binding protein [Deltaproteobacteria bacterium GWC2_42_11]HBO84073.1 molybdate ABC transporter substrate-binding protein [Deltaproteobacteria bacterium]